MTVWLHAARFFAGCGSFCVGGVNVTPSFLQLSGGGGSSSPIGGLSGFTSLRPASVGSLAGGSVFVHPVDADTDTKPASADTLATANIFFTMMIAPRHLDGSHPSPAM